MLRVNKICKSYENPVLTDFSYEFPDRGLILVRGSSGCGKTTLLRILAELEKSDRGTIEREKSITLSCVFQEARLVPHLTVLENVLLVGGAKDKAHAVRLLTRLGLGSDLNKFPDELSGGMKLRASIARSLYYGGDLYLWDEPTKELDPENRAIVSEIIRELAEKACVVVVTHDPELKSEREILF